MKVKRLKYLPIPSSMKMITFFWIIFTRQNANVTMVDENHEEIHLFQKLEMAAIGLGVTAILCALGLSPWWLFVSLITWHVWYGIEWLFRLVQYRDFHTAYRNIAFEREAFSNDDNVSYLKTRNRFAWIKYLRG